MKHRNTLQYAFVQDIREYDTLLLDYIFVVAIRHCSNWSVDAVCTTMSFAKVGLPFGTKEFAVD